MRFHCSCMIYSWDAWYGLGSSPQGLNTLFFCMHKVDIKNRLLHIPARKIVLSITEPGTPPNHGIDWESDLLSCLVADNLAANFSRELADYIIYIIDVSAGDKIPRKGGPGITQADLLVGDFVLISAVYVLAPIIFLIWGIIIWIFWYNNNLFNYRW